MSTKLTAAMIEDYASSAYATSDGSPSHIQALALEVQRLRLLGVKVKAIRDTALRLDQDFIAERLSKALTEAGC